MQTPGWDPRHASPYFIENEAARQRERFSRGGLSSLPTITLILLAPFLLVVLLGRLGYRGLRKIT
jgi:hypothetical protein